VRAWGRAYGPISEPDLTRADCCLACTHHWGRGGGARDGGHPVCWWVRSGDVRGPAGGGDVTAVCVWVLKA
jgi:hypothetical protein